MARVALGALLVATGALYLLGLGASGWANPYYAGAAQAGSVSWSAFLFGASDAAGSITIDKPPLTLWPMALSVRLFGLSSWSVLVPQALMGVGAVALLAAAVRRASGSPWAGILAGTVLATTPVAVLMFRYDNPEALLTLLLTGAAYAVVRALDSPRAVRWLVLGGALVGLAFLTKSLQAFLVLPGLALAYALFAAVPWRRRVVHLLAAFGAVLVAGGWWVAIVELVPTSRRPYLGGSQDDSALGPVVGSNGVSRLAGDDTVPRSAGWGEPGPLRLLGADDGAQVAWLLPAALALGVAALVWGDRATRGLAVALLGWLLVSATTFSAMAGVYHPYYTVVLAPTIGGLMALGAVALWRRRESTAAVAVLAGTVAVTTGWAFVLLARIPDWHAWLRFAVLALGLGSAVALVVVRRSATAVAAVAAVVAVLAGPVAHSLSTAATPHSGSVPTAGPTSRPGDVPGHAVRWAGGDGGEGPESGVGELHAGGTSTAGVTAALLDDAGDYTWVAATVGANTAAGFQLATERPVMPVGGYHGSDPSPTLARFRQLVADGEIHWFVADGGGHMRGPGEATAPAITAWVEATFTPTTVDGVTLYDLSAPSEAPGS